MDKRIKRSLEVLRNLPKYLEASRARSHDHSIPLDSARNRCLKQIEVIQGTNSPHKEEALKEAWKIYLQLHDFQARSGERLDYNPQREVSLDNLGNLDNLQESGIVETPAPDLYAGGLGYRHVNWDAEYLMAVDGSERHPNPYWNPKEATVKPVKHFTKEEIEAVNCPRW